MTSWSSYRDTRMGERAAAAVRLADVLLQSGQFSNADSGAALFPDRADEVFARGRYCAEEIRPFVQYFDFDLEMASGTRVRGVYPASLAINLIFKGRWRSVIDGRPVELTRAGVPSVWGAGQEFESVIAPTPGQRIRAAALYIDGDFFHSAPDVESLTPVFAKLLGPGTRYWELPSCAVLRSILHRLYENPYRGAMRRLYAESLALSAIVELGVHVGGGTCRVRKISRTHLDRVHEARAILDREMESPSSVRDLARRVGTTEITLRRLFKSIFGTTVADYVRQARLEAARHMLREGSLRISEIAWRVGYSDPANFTAAYRHRFGHPPTREVRGGER